MRRPEETAAGERSSNVLPAHSFALVAGWALRRAFRCSEYTCLISIGIRRECTGWSVGVGSDAHVEIVAAITPFLRETDLCGDIDDETFAILLSDADEAAGCQVVQRLTEPLGSVRFSAPLIVAIGRAISPTDGVAFPELVAHSASHPILVLRPTPMFSDRRLECDEAPSHTIDRLHRMEEQT